MSRTASWRVLASLLWALSLGACGYTHGVRLPAGAQSVAVSVFDNASPFPEVERDVFSCMSTQASRMVNSDLLAPNRADLVIRGKILDYQRLRGVLNRDGELLTSGVRISLQAWIEDRRLGERIGRVLEFEQPVRYIFGAGEREAGARRAALEHLCQEIVLDLFNQIDYPSASEALEPAPEVLEPQPLEGRDIDESTPERGTPE